MDSLNFTTHNARLANEGIRTKGDLLKRARREANKGLVTGKVGEGNFKYNPDITAEQQRKINMWSKFNQTYTPDLTAKSSKAMLGENILNNSVDRRTHISHLMRQLD